MSENEQVKKEEINNENKGEHQEKPLSESGSQRDYLKIVDETYAASAGAGDWVSKLLDLLGPHKGPVFFGLVLSGTLSLMDYMFLSKMVIVLIVLVVLLKVVFSRKTLRDTTNKAISSGLDKAGKAIARKSSQVKKE